MAIALAFIAFFGLVVVAVFNYAGATTLQHGQTENAASVDAIAEGGAIFAAQDANAAAEAPPASLACVGSAPGPPNSATLQMQTGDTLSYSINQCNPGSSAVQPLANECVLCLLSPNGTDLSFTTASTPQTLKVDGPVAINSATSIVAGDTLQSTAQPPFIGCVTPSICTTGSYIPPVAQITAVTDPLSNLATPNVSGPCGNLNNPTVPITAGWYCSISLSANRTYTFGTGIYVISGSFQVSGQAHVQTAAGGALFFFGCASYPTPCSNGGQSGASLSASGKGVLITPTTIAPYTGLSLAFDRNDTGGSGGCPAGFVVCISGNGASIGGTVVTHSGNVSIQGNGASSIDGSLIANSLAISVSANAGAGLAVGGTSSKAFCWVYDVSAKGAPSGSSTAISGYAVGNSTVTLVAGAAPSTGETISLNGGTAETFVVETVKGSSVSLSAPIQRTGHTTASWYSVSHAIIESACSGGQGKTDIVSINYQP